MRKLTPVVLLLLLASAAPAAELVEKIVARVNDRLITHSDFEKRFAVFLQSPQAGNNPIEARRKLLAEIIDERLLEERAKELQVAATDEEVEVAVERVKRQYNLATDEEFENALKSSNLTRDDLKRQMRNTITLQKVVGRDISSKLDMSDDTLRLEYERRKEQLYKVVEQAEVSEIVVRFDPDDPRGSRARGGAHRRGAGEDRRGDAVRGRREGVLGGQREGAGRRARQREQGRARHGSRRRGLLRPAAGAPAGRAPLFFDPPLSRDGPAPGGYRPFAEVREDLRARIGDDLYDKRYSEYIDKLRRDAFIKIYDPALETKKESGGAATPPKVSG